MAETLKIFRRERRADRRARKAYGALALEYAIARAVVEARTALGITRAQLAARMDTSQS